MECIRNCARLLSFFEVGASSDQFLAAAGNHSMAKTIP
jgi:hypothetical protein